MKNFLAITLMGIAVAAMAVMTSPIIWEKTSLDLGEVKANETTALSFEFTNSGDQPVTILSAKGSCGCTNVTHTKEAINPGKSTRISANFKSGKPGNFNKTITVITDQNDKPTVLRFSGTVVE
ncbi:MAG: DUF1573 domain-containing protein [Cyclobacteriaceae bacterium]